MKHPHDNLPALSVVVLLVAASLMGCPPAPATNANGQPVADPKKAAEIAITEDMEPAERAIVEQLNMTRDTVWYGDRRAELLKAWAILKSQKAVTVLADKKVEEED